MLLLDPQTTKTKHVLRFAYLGLGINPPELRQSHVDMFCRHQNSDILTPPTRNPSCR